MALPTYIFGGDTGETPESIAARRKQAAALFAQQAPKNIGEGFNAIGQSLLAVALMNAADREHKAGQAGAQAALGGSSLLGALGFGGGAPAAPAAPAAAPAAPGAASPALPSLAASQTAGNGFIAGIDDRYSPDEAKRELALWNSNPRPDTVSGFNDKFAIRKAAFLEDNPFEASVGIGSGYRSPERQAELYQQAVAKYGSEAAARKWVAPPGRSNHNHGTAADLQFDDPRARQWAHANAAKYGLSFPMGHEPWHVELAGVRGGVKPSAPAPAIPPAPAADPSMAPPIQVADMSGGIPMPPPRPREFGGSGEFLAQQEAARAPTQITPPVMGSNGLPSPFVPRTPAPAPAPAPMPAPAMPTPGALPADAQAQIMKIVNNPFVPQATKQLVVQAYQQRIQQEQARAEYARKRSDEIADRYEQRAYDAPVRDVDMQSKRLGMVKTQKEIETDSLQTGYDANGNEVKGYMRGGRFVQVGGAKAGDDYRTLTTPEDRAAAGIPPDFKGPVQVDRSGKLSFPGKAGTEVTIKNEGSIPAGYRVMRDQQGNAISAEPIPGTPAAKEAAGAAKKEGLAAANTKMKGNVVLSALDDIDRVGKTAILPTSGMGSTLAAKIPGTAAHDVQSALTTIGANISFENLSQMRAASPTGGALGAVSDAEQKMLQSAWGALNQSQSPEQFKLNLSRVRDIYETIIHGKPLRPAAPADTAAPVMPGQAGAAPVKATTQQEYMALPSGATFIDPNGDERVKP